MLMNVVVAPTGFETVSQLAPDLRSALTFNSSKSSSLHLTYERPWLLQLICRPELKVSASIMESLTLESPDNLLAIEKRPSSEMGDEERVSSPNAITIDDQGDVILVAGLTHLRVSSHVLRLASPAFRAMLEPGRFLEGQTHRDSYNPAKVQLEDDDPEALALLCNILHFKSVKSIFDVGLLAALADICDKYQCTFAVRHYIASWLPVLYHCLRPNLEQIQLLWVAFAFDLPFHFEEISSVLSKQLDAAAVESIHMHEGLPDSVRRL